MNAYNFVSFAGIFILLFGTYLFSNNRQKVNWRLIAWGIGIQAVFAVFIFQVPFGSRFFLWLNDIVVKVLSCAVAGSEFLFGRLALAPGTSNAAGEPSLGFYLAFQGLTAIVFFSALTAILYYIGFLPWLIRMFSRVFTRLMGISGAESLCAASNIFVGVESALTIEPYIERMTRSELCTILTCGMASVASNVLAVYVFTLNPYFPTIAAHLISASFLSAPAGLIMSKILFPETETPETIGKDIDVQYERPPSIYAAVIEGSQTGLKLVMSISALLISIIGLVALIDLILGAGGQWVNTVTGLSIKWSLASLMGYIFYIPTLILGVPLADAWHIAQVIGERSIVTEVIAYQDLAKLMATDSLQHARSAVIATYALCGFAHVGSIAIFVGGISALAQKRTNEIALSGIRALVAATLACLMTACIAGTFYTNSSILMP